LSSKNAGKFVGQFQDYIINLTQFFLKVNGIGLAPAGESSNLNWAVLHSVLMAFSRW
jgi:hypothetical protein